MQEQELNDIGLNFLRPQLVTVPGCSRSPTRTAGKQRQVMIDLDQSQLQAKGLSPVDVVNAVAAQNLILPSGTVKIGQFEYDVDMNASPKTIPEIANFPIKVVGNSTIYVRDVGNVRNGFAPQTNIVRQDGQRRRAHFHLKGRKFIHARHCERHRGLAAASGCHASSGP